MSLSVILTLIALSACSETPSPTESARGLRLQPDVPVLAVLDCSGSARGITCRPAAGLRLGAGPLFDRIIGGQDLYVKLTAVEGTQDFDPGEFVVSQQVTVQNLTVHPFGTTDWAGEATPAVRVFFHSGPHSTGGTAGDVTVVGPDGTDTFTESDQEFYEYPEIFPANQENREPKTWAFQLPDATTTFSFQVYVAAKMPDEGAPLTPPAHTFTHLAGGSIADHTCAVRTGGAEYCWGADAFGQLGLGDAGGGNRTTPAGVLGNVSLTGLVRGGGIGGLGHTCGLTSSGAAYCWGYNGYGQLGVSADDFSNRTTPTPVLGGHAFTALAAGAYHTCGLTSAGVAYCWGRNDEGQIGDGTSTSRPTPTPVGGGFAFASLTGGGYHTCGVSSSGAARCWGYNFYGQIGDGTTGTNRTTPVAVLEGLSFTALVAGYYHTCGLTSTTAGNAYCWGRNANGELGNGDDTFADSDTPVQVEGDLTFTALAAGGLHTCGLVSGGAAYCWGYDGEGGLGNGDALGAQNVPGPVSGGLSFTALAPGALHTCGLVSSGAAYCWGWDGSGQLGNGSVTTANQHSPVAVQMP